MIDTTPDKLKSSLDAGNSLFLKLYKPGCGACKLSRGATDRLEKEYSEKLEFVQINTETFPEMLSIANTEVLPCFFTFSAGKKTGTFIGFKGIAKLKELIEQAIK